VFRPQSGYTGFSVDDVRAAESFYRDVLGLETEVLVQGQMFRLRLPGGAAWVLVYGKPDHVPATYTVVNFVVDDVDDALDDLARLGLEPQRDGPYVDERGVMRGRSVDRGPDIAWFIDPAGNVFSVQQT
jgi:catechol 2,3-dioxygenase-like lactoylglutathione lyase family enzyme